MVRSIGQGIFTTLIGAFPIAAMVALCYRFPIPLAGYQSGPTAMLMSVLAVFIYGIIGGFVVLVVWGALSGATAYLTCGDNAKLRQILIIGLALAGDFAGVMTLAMLDKIIGPW